MRFDGRRSEICRGHRRVGRKEDARTAAAALVGHSGGGCLHSQWRESVIVRAQQEVEN